MLIIHDLPVSHMFAAVVKGENHVRCEAGEVHPPQEILLKLITTHYCIFVLFFILKKINKTLKKRKSLVFTRKHFF